MKELKCRNCGKVFTQKTITQVYCSTNCRILYLRHHKANRPVLTFICAYCGDMVTTKGGEDMRTRFCCETCERKYWKHPDSQNIPAKEEVKKDFYLRN